MDRAAALATKRPRGQLPPDVRPGFKRRHGSDVRRRRVILQIMIEKRSQNLLAKIESRIAVEFQRPKFAAIANLLAVMPGTHHQKHFVVLRVLRLDRFIHRDRTVDVFLIPETVDQHYRHLERFLCQELVDGVRAPECVVLRMLEQH